LYTFYFVNPKIISRKIRITLEALHYTVIIINGQHKNCGT